MRTLDLSLLRTLDAIARHATFAAAAEQLHQTQSAVTQQMQRLQAEVGSPLFEKHGRVKRLTVQGEHLLSYARRMLALNDQALRSARATRCRRCASARRMTWPTPCSPLCWPASCGSSPICR